LDRAPNRSAANAVLSASHVSPAGRVRRVRYSANLARKRDRVGEAMRGHDALLDAQWRRAGRELSDTLFLHLRNKLAAAGERSEISDDPPRRPLRPAISEVSHIDG
jgi:hypothetical protein